MADVVPGNLWDSSLFYGFSQIVKSSKGECASSARLGPEKVHSGAIFFISCGCEFLRLLFSIICWMYDWAVIGFKAGKTGGEVVENALLVELSTEGF